MAADPLAALFAALDTFLATYYAGMRADSLSITFQADDSGGARPRCLTLVVPEPTSDDPESLTACERDIVILLSDVNRRMTTEQVLRGLQEAGKDHGDSTVIHTLADLCQRKHRLSNKKDARGRGYGLADWN